MSKKTIGKIAACVGIAFFCLSLNSPANLIRHGEPLSSPVHAGFFSDDLEIFEEVLMLVSRKYVYPPDYKRIFSSAIEEMVKTAGLENLIFEDTDLGQTIFKDNNKVTYNLDADRARNFRAFKKVYYFLMDEFNGLPSKQELEVAGITGIMNALDPYSQYLDKKLFNRSMRETEGQYGGLGMVITMMDYQPVVVKTMKNSPAQRARILSGDIITKVNGKEVKGLLIGELATILRGYPNTQVTVAVLRPSTKIEVIHTLTREIISVATVEYRVIGDHTGLIKITSFSKQTQDQLQEALGKARLDGVKSFILDLRNNPGGLLDQSVKVTSNFLKRGRLVVYTQGRKKSDRQEYRASYKNTWHNFPIVVLVNQLSASASEIVAGALRDSGRALIVGETSFGKGSVQTIFRIRDDSGIRLTTSKYYTPSGIDITEHGIVPEIRIVDDLLYQKGDSFLNKVAEPDQLRLEDSYISLKKSDVEKFLKGKGMTVDRENDPTLLFAHLIVRNSAVADKDHAMAKARELAANILY